jgi:serine/threonine protein kinase
MVNRLPGSSDASHAEIARLQQQCDRVRAENELHSLDHQDQESTAAVILRISSAGSTHADGDSLSRFSNIEFVGRGAFGMVFACDDAEQHGKRVAVKILRTSRHNDRIARERFQEELKVMSGFNHPSIVRVFGTGEIDQIPYMVTEFADVGSVASLMVDQPERVSPRQAAWLVSCVAEAVQEAHTSPILHRDIKPGNILLRKESMELSEGLGLWPLLNDFGLSKNLGPSSSNPLTFEGEVLGTLSYMSPEQVRGQPLKTQSDIFPLGVILHELAYGQHPFLDESDFQTRHNIVQGSPSKPQGHYRVVPARLEAIITKCLQKNPEDRYLHASDLAKDLQRFLRGEPISVSPPTPWDSARRWVATHPIASTFLGTALFFMVSSILLLSREWSIQSDLAKSSRALAEDRAKISKLFLESMRATNSGINDTILSGKRVSPTALLRTLEHQVPLLEDALALAPDDYLLIRQLEVMYHYKSLSHSYAQSTTDQTAAKSHQAQAIQARQKSLDYIQMLLQRFPEEENLLISKMNGEFFMSRLVQTDSDEKKVWQNWISRAIASSETFLAKHPDNIDVLESANAMRIDWCCGIASEDPAEAIRLLKEISDLLLFLQIEHPTRTNLFTYAAQAVTRRCCILLDEERELEALESFRGFEAYFDTYRGALDNDWKVTETLFSSYAILCGALIKSNHFKDAYDMSNRWQLLVKSVAVASQTEILGHLFKGPEFVAFLPIYYRWQASSRLAPDSPEHEATCSALRDAFDRCRNRSEAELETLVRLISQIESPVALESFKAVTSGGPIIR